MAYLECFLRIRRSRQNATALAGIHRLMNVEFLIRTSLLWSSGFSRSRFSLQYAAALAGIHRLMNVEFLIRALWIGVPASAGSGVPGSMPLPWQAYTG
jgi:hypothetical protein